MIGLRVVVPSLVVLVLFLYFITFYSELLLFPNSMNTPASWINETALTKWLLRPTKLNVFNDTRFSDTVSKFEPPVLTASLGDSKNSGISGNISKTDLLDDKKSVNTTAVTKIFYFAVTHSSTIEKRLDASLKTWCARILAHTGRKVVWYSNAPDPRVDHVISVDGVDSYANITWRMIAIWEHVSMFYPGYMWYSRFWDDNYVIPETFEPLILNVIDIPVEIGRYALASTGRLVSIGTEHIITKEMHPYMDGGAGSLLSSSGLKQMISGMGTCRKWLLGSARNQFTCSYACEDVLFGYCAFNFFGIKFQRALGMYHGSPPAHPVSQFFCIAGALKIYKDVV
jgi:hypothetical protein